jgi:hypothetical protein
MAGFAALVALLFFAIPAQSDEIEPESEPAPQAESEPAPEPEPEPVPDVVSEEEEAFSEPAWIPSIEVGFEAHGYDVDTTITNFWGINPPTDAQFEESDQILFRIGGELMGPDFLESRPVGLRLFVQGGVGFTTFSNDRVFEIGDPDVDNELETQPEDAIDYYYGYGPRDFDFPTDFPGQGSRLDANLQNPSWYAGLGIAFSVPTSMGLLFYIKPSVQYSVEDIDFMGKLTTVEETTDPPAEDPNPCGTVAGPPLCQRTFQDHYSSVNFSTTDHSIGPGLEVAMAFLSSRPIRISVFAQVRALWLVSDKTNSVTGYNVPDPDDPVDPYPVASYSVERDDFAVRGGVGVRLSWVGFD